MEIVTLEGKTVERIDHVLPILGKTPAAACECLKCGHKWMVNAPIYTDDLECQICWEIKQGIREDEQTVSPFIDLRDSRDL